MSDTFLAATNRTASSAVELTIEGLQWMLLRSAFGTVNNPYWTRSVPCEVWLNAYDAAPETVREDLARSGMTNAWSPAIEAALEKTGVDLDDLDVDTPLDAFVGAATYDKLSDGAIKRLFRVLQRCGLFAAADRRDLASKLTSSANGLSPRAFALLLTDPNVDAALPGTTRCSAGDAHNSPRHHSVRLADEHETVHDVLCLAVRSAAAHDPAVWRAFSDARLPFGARAMAEEWAYELTGPCGCAGAQRIDHLNALHYAIEWDNDKAGEWLAARLPPKRLNERDGGDNTPLIEALRSHNPMPRTVAALLSRVPDVDLAPRWRFVDGKERNAAEWMAAQTRYWHPPHLAAELKLKTEQFGSQYLPSAATLCTEQLFVHMGMPRELVNLVLQYTALPQPHLWLNTRPGSAGGGTADGLTHRPAEQGISGQKRDRDTAFGASTGPSAAAPLLRHKRTKRK